MSIKKVKLNLNNIKNFAYALQRAKGTVNDRLISVMDKWASETQSKYDSFTPYNKIHGKTSYYMVKPAKRTALYVSVGHASYIAKFLEVGTKAHSIVHRINDKPILANVRGIRGNKALGRAWNNKKKEVASLIEKEINNILSGGSNI